MPTESQYAKGLVPHRGYIELDRREYNGWTLLFCEDRGKKMMLPDGTSKHYILCVETRAVESSNINRSHYRYITKLMGKKTGQSAKDIAREMFLHPENYKNILGDHWVIFSSASSHEPRKRKSLKSV